MPCHCRERQVGVQLSSYPIECRSETVVGPDSRDGRCDELGLPTLTVGSHYEIAGNQIGDVRAEVEAHQVNGQVESGGRSGAGENLTVIHIKNIGVEVNVGVPRPKPLSRIPMRGGATTIQDSRLRQEKRSGAERNDSDPTSVGPL